VDNKQSMQHWLDRNRPPRVQITYDVETLGATVKEQIPFIVGIIGDFAGGARPASTMTDRAFVEIDPDNFKQVMAGIAPALTLDAKQPYTVSRAPDGTTYAPDATATATPFPVALAFQSMDDFGPGSIIKQVPALAALMQTRRNLADLLAKLGTDPSQERTLKTVAGPPALVAVKASLLAVNNALTDATTGFQKMFGDAVTAVAPMEAPSSGDGQNVAPATDGKAAPSPSAEAKTTVDKAVTDFTPIYAAGSADGATLDQMRTVSGAAWNTVSALRAPVAALEEVLRGYTPPAGDEAKKKAAEDAATAVEAVRKSLDDLIPQAWQAKLSADSAFVVAPAS
jgi:type VI secretion system protein ImpB